MKLNFAFFWFVLCLALAAAFGWQHSKGRKQQIKAEALQLQVEKLAQESRSAAAELKEVSQERTRLRGEMLSAEAQLARARALQTAAAAPGEKSAAVAPKPAKNGDAAETDGGGLGGVLSKMMKDPEMRKAMQQQQRMGLNLAYSALFKKLELTPEQEEKFKSLMLEQQMSSMSNAQALLDGGTNRTDVAAAMNDERKQREEQMKQLLGEDKYAQYQDYNQTISERLMLDQFGKEAQITPDQTEQLLSIVKEEKKNIQINTGAIETPNTPKDFQAVMQSPEQSEKMFQQQAQVNERVLERAGSVLSPEQVSKLGPILQNQIEMQRAGMKMAQEMLKGRNSTQDTQK